jgi:hypothetical protein
MRTNPATCRLPFGTSPKREGARPSGFKGVVLEFPIVFRSGVLQASSFAACVSLVRAELVSARFSYPRNSPAARCRCIQRRRHSERRGGSFLFSSASRGGAASQTKNPSSMPPTIPNVVARPSGFKAAVLDFPRHSTSVSALLRVLRASALSFSNHQHSA